MKISKKKLMRIISEEISLIKESGDLEEGRFGSLAKAIATPLVPGGRFISDYSQARGFDELEDFAGDAESKLADLEQRVAAIESLIQSAP
jgi:hypothetical protein